MNTFFKSTVYAAFVGLTIFSSCSDEIKDFTVKPDGTEQGDGSTTTAETKNLIINATATGKKWVVEDVIYVGSPSAAENEVTIDNQSSGFTKFTVSKIGEGATSASFEGEIPANLSGKKLLVFYGNAADMKVAASKVTLDLASQNGTLMSATADYTGEESINATFSVENASAELKIQTTDVSGLTEATLSFDESSAMGFTSSKEFTAEGVGTYTMQKSMTATLTAGEDDEYTISFIPTVSETPATMNISLKATKESGDYTYKATKEISSSSNYDVEIKSENVDNNLLGEGTEASPYIVDNVDKFMGMTETTDKFYQLSRDLDFTDIEFTPIATFAGTFDGGNNTLSEIKFNVSENNGGIFALNKGSIKNLIVTNTNFTKETAFGGNTNGTGILVGLNEHLISNCKVVNSNIEAKVIDEGNVGLLVGFNKGTGKVESSTVDAGTVTINSNSTYKCNVGGLVGKSLGNIEFSFVINKTSISYNPNIQDSNIGGFIGAINYCSIIGCSSNADVSAINTTGAITIGGFIGTAWTTGEVSIKGCYSIGSINSPRDNTEAGFIANLSGSGSKKIKNCYTGCNFKTDFGKNTAFTDNHNKISAENCWIINGTQSKVVENVNVTDATTLKNKVESFNDLGWENYLFTTGSDAEPLVITKK